MEEPIKEILKAIGEDPNREGLRDTPSRFDKAFRYMTRGYEQDVGEILNDALFSVEYDEMVIVKDIDVYSLCEHHLMPFFGKAHVGYVPRGKVIGLSKIPRMVDVFARRLQVQERLTQQIAETIQKVIDPKGVAVVLECHHLCVMMRGVEKQNATMVTSSMLGYFRKDQKSRNEFLNLIKTKQ